MDFFRAYQNKIFGAQLRASQPVEQEKVDLLLPREAKRPHGSKNFQRPPHLGSSGAGGSFQTEETVPGIILTRMAAGR